MTRINVFGEGILVGWFDIEKGIRFEEETEWNGHDHVSINAGPNRYQTLYRTAGGRWVLQSSSDWQGDQTRFRFVDDRDAREWLLRNNQDDAVVEWLGPIEPEHGPVRVELGSDEAVRLGNDLLARVDADAAAHGETREAALRRLVVAALP